MYTDLKYFDPKTQKLLTAETWVLSSVAAKPEMTIRNEMAPNTGLMKSSAGKIRKWVKNHGIITKINLFHPAPCITLPRSPLIYYRNILRKRA
ncbi:hypothetical protein PoB_007070900 [Plakobranchus ocellatus]|uniref:Uncharacterized protein n=1 Tax=Plakobranchus ocellatus TaxID=259542 RepID=A0AAV4DJJ2_9GAST|nr:hypothetical protein PoB_007070900 [Plakobranchus ocellatus]